MNEADLAELFGRFLLLGLLAVGGMNTVLPGMFRYVVDERGWMSARQFADLYALAQASPGPNAMYVTLFGLQVGGGLGAAATTLAIFLPATVLTLAMIALNAGRADSPLRVALRRGLAPIALGLVLSSGWLLLRSVDHDWASYLATAATVLAVLRTRINPLWLIAAGALAGIAGLV
jgi:chromate transporter